MSSSDKVITLRFNKDEWEKVEKMMSGEGAVSTQVKRILTEDQIVETILPRIDQLVSIIGPLIERLESVEKRLDGLTTMQDKVGRMEDFLSRLSEDE